MKALCYEDDAEEGFIFMMERRDDEMEPSDNPCEIVYGREQREGVKTFDGAGGIKE